MDSHIHVSGVGETAQFLNLGSCYSIFEFKVAIRKYLDIRFNTSTHNNDTGNTGSSSEQTNKQPIECNKFVVGVQWDQSQLSRYPTRIDIDEACSIEFGEMLLELELSKGKAGARVRDRGEKTDIRDYTHIPVCINMYIYVSIYLYTSNL